jgi:hypothetical protein
MPQYLQDQTRKGLRRQDRRAKRRTRQAATTQHSRSPGEENPINYRTFKVLTYYAAAAICGATATGQCRNCGSENLQDYGVETWATDRQGEFIAMNFQDCKYLHISTS